jgi:hypothetical protein
MRAPENSAKRIITEMGKTTTRLVWALHDRWHLELSSHILVANLAPVSPRSRQNRATGLMSERDADCPHTPFANMRERSDDRKHGQKSRTTQSARFCLYSYNATGAFRKQGSGKDLADRLRKTGASGIIGKNFQEANGAWSHVEQSTHTLSFPLVE